MEETHEKGWIDYRQPCPACESDKSNHTHPNEKPVHFQCQRCNFTWEDYGWGITKTEHTDESHNAHSAEFPQAQTFYTPSKLDTIKVTNLFLSIKHEINALTYKTDDHEALTALHKLKYACAELTFLFTK